MPVIHFECPLCNQPLDATEELAGQLLDCPKCNQTIEVPVRSRPAQPPPVSQDTTSNTSTPPKNLDVNIPKIEDKKPTANMPDGNIPALHSNKLGSRPINVIVKDFEMSFGSMVLFMFMWLLATIVAALILAAFGAFLFAIVYVIQKYTLT